MATVSETIAKEIIKYDGFYCDDPRVHQVIKYTNMWGKEEYAILYRRDIETNRYAPTDFVQNPQIIWQAD